jgi:hypothetical protein
MNVASTINQITTYICVPVQACNKQKCPRILIFVFQYRTVVINYHLDDGKMPSGTGLQPPICDNFSTACSLRHPRECERWSPDLARTLGTKGWRSTGNWWRRPGQSQRWHRLAGPVESHRSPYPLSLGRETHRCSTWSTWARQK